MKHIFTFALFFLSLSLSFAQIKSSSEDFKIPNGDFENWYTVTNPVNPGVDYEEIGSGPTDNWMGTLNSLAMVPPTNFGPGPITVYKTTDKHAGNYAAKAVSANFPLGPFTVFIPGMIGTAVMDNKSISAVLGKPCPDCRPTRFKGFYKYEPVSGDSCTVLVQLSKWNATTKTRETVGFASLIERNAVATYKEFDLPLTYLSAQPVDTMTMLVVSSAGMNFTNFMLCKGQAGSTIYVDDLSVDYTSGMRQILNSDVHVNIYPNPASDILHIELGKPVSNAVLEVFNAAVEPAGSYQLTGQRTSISLSGFAGGAYFYRLMSGKDMLNTGTFIIK